jgi:hypothetical protein
MSINPQVAIKSIKRENIKTERHLLRVTREIRALKLLGMYTVAVHWCGYLPMHAILRYRLIASFYYSLPLTAIKASR